MRKYTIFDIGRSHKYFNEKKNREVMLKVAKKCYLPMNNLILNQISSTNGRFKAAFSLSGTFIDQAEKHCPEVIESFADLAKTGCVEFLGETYYHSLAFMFSKTEFKEQVNMHRKKITELFDQKPVVFRNTELIYNNELSEQAKNLGFNTVLAEGADHILGWRSPNFVYSANSPGSANSEKIDNEKNSENTNNKKSSEKININKKVSEKINKKTCTLLLKNYRLSDDIAFRFSNHDWTAWPLTTEKFTSWINNVNGNGHVVNLFMDYETFGEHQWPETGIFNFMKQLPAEHLKHPDNDFKTPSEASRAFPVMGSIDMPFLVSWADIERDTSAWLGNKMQESAARELYLLEGPIKRAYKKTKDPSILRDWRLLQTSDHFYYMCTKWFSDGDVHKYFNPYETPYEAYMYFMNILNDLKIRLKETKQLSGLSRDL